MDSSARMTRVTQNIRPPVKPRRSGRVRADRLNKQIV